MQVKHQPVHTLRMHQLAYLVCILTRVSLHRSECIKEYRHIKEERNWRFCEACWAKQHKKVGR